MFKIDYIMLNNNEDDKYSFSKNTTYVYGKNNVGKTLLYRTIYYILGTEDETIWQLNGMENVVEINCKVSNSDSVLFLKRTNEHKLYYRRNESDNYNFVSREVYVGEIQKLIFENSELVTAYKDSVGEKMSYRGWVYLNFINENSLGNISPIITEANEVKNFKRIHKQMDFIFDYENLLKLNELLKEKEALENELKNYLAYKTKYDHLSELIDTYFEKLNLIKEESIEKKEEAFNIYLSDSITKYDEVMVKSKDDLMYLMKASAYLEEQIKIDSTYENQNNLVNTKNKKIELLLLYLEKALIDKEKYSAYLKSIKEVLNNNRLEKEIISLKDYSRSIEFLKDKKRKIDLQIKELRNSIIENEPEDILKYIENLKVYFAEIKLIPNFDKYLEIQTLLDEKNEEIKKVKNKLGNYDSKNINEFLTDKYKSLPSNIGYVEEDKGKDKFEMTFSPSTLSITAYKTNNIDGKKVRTVYIPGSKARFTCWQILGYISLYSFVIKKFNEFPILPLLVIDGFHEPFDHDGDNYKKIVDFFIALCDECNIQLIVMSTRNDINKENVNYIDLSEGFNSLHE